MPSTKDLTQAQQKGLFALFKGPPNSAKSGAAYSFPDAFVFDFDRKMPTIAQKHFPNNEFNWETFNEVYTLSEYLKPYLDMNPINGSFKEFPHETIIVDSVTSLSTLCLASLDKTKGTDVIKMMQTTVGKSKTVEVMGFDYYNAEANFFERYFMEKLKILWSRSGNPKHIIVIAHEITVESAPDISTGMIRSTKSIVTAGRKVAAYIPSRFDEEYVFELEKPPFGDSVSKNKRICITGEQADARTAYKFDTRIDFTNKSLYDILNKTAKWSSIGVNELTSPILSNIK